MVLVTTMAEPSRDLSAGSAQLYHLVLCKVGKELHWAVLNRRWVTFISQIPLTLFSTWLGVSTSSDSPLML